ncbi:MAG: hypothetical protein IPJ30_03700 [Acidobacteria bacterium]|nr:hypothetical protein [Acidobacteriota bacterium]
MIRSLVLIGALIAASMVASAQSIPETEFPGRVIATIADGDFVHPTLSPDGKIVAFSRVVVTGGMELSEIRVRDLGTSQTRVLMTSERSRRYAAYSAYVVRFIWQNNRRFVAEVADGDVDSTLLTFDAVNGRLLKTVPSGPPDFENDSLVSPELMSSVPLMRQLRPRIPDEVIFSAFQRGNGAFKASRRSVVFQHKYNAYPNDINLVDFGSKSIRVLLSLPGDPRPAPSLLGGFARGGSIVFAVEADGSIKLYDFGGAGTVAIAELKNEDATSPGFVFDIKQRSPERVVFTLRPASTLSKTAAAVWIADARGIRRIRFAEQLLDLDIRGSRLAISYWSGKARHISIRELLPDRKPSK